MSLGLALTLICLALMVGAVFGALLVGVSSVASHDDDVRDAELRIAERRAAPAPARRHSTPDVVNRRGYARQQHPVAR